jgi:hypothetical protein
MASIRYFFFSILLWVACFNIAIAETSITKTQDEPSSSAALPQLSTATLPSSTSLSSSGASSSISNAKATATTASTTHSQLSSSTSTAVPTDSGAIQTSDSLGNNVDSDGILPIDPRITPAFGIGGALLIMTGLGYALVGIQSDYVYIFLSVAYLVSLSITVLILYVMNLPVSDAIQGVYLVGIVLPGLILAGGACVFKDITNSVGCIFGGFSLAMWFLVLKPGGLLTTTMSVSIFIVGFCLVTFATSFHRLTRPYGLIGSFAFGGATAVTLGIDCFTRAGLKEFWAYIWNLNPKLFPYGTTTYPLTRGMKVEIAVIILVTIVGVVAQLHLWKYMKKRGDKKNAERLEEGRRVERRDEMIGRRVEFTNTRALNQWEAVYGENNDGNDNHSADSGIADMDNLKKLPRINVQSTHGSGAGSGSGSDIEMSDLPSPRSHDQAKQPDQNFGLIVGARKNSESQPASPVEADSRRTSHLSLDPASRRVSTSGSWRALDANGGTESNSKRNSRRSSKRLSIPLETSNQKSFEDDAHSPLSPTFDENRKSKRFSRGSGLLRQLSQKSQKRLSKHSTKSKENLVEEAQDWDDRRSSVAATVDYLSETDDSDDLDRLPGRSPRDSIIKDNKSDTGAGRPSSVPASPVDESLRHSFLLVEAVGKELESLRSTPDTTGSKGNASATANGQLTVAALTKDALPPDAPRIITTYRTSQWMKHLSHADIPVVEDPTVAEDDAKESQDTEASAPVDIKQLQQTSLTGQVAPALPRSVSQASVLRTQHLNKALTSLQGQSTPERISQIPATNTNRALPRSSSQQSLTPQQARLLQTVSRKSSNQSITPQQAELLQSISRSPSTQSLQNNPTLQTLRSYRASSNPIGPTLVESPTKDNFPTTSRLSTSQYPSTTSLQKRSSSQHFPSLPTTQETPSDDPLTRSILRQSSLPYIPGTGTRLPTQPAPIIPAPNRTSQLVAFRSSIQLVQAQNSGQPQSQTTIPNPYTLGLNTQAGLAAGMARPSVDDINMMEDRRRALWDEKIKAETRKRMEEQGRVKRESVLGQRVGRKGRAEEAHRRVMRALMKEGGGAGALGDPSAGSGSGSKRTSMS